MKQFYPIILVPFLLLCTIFTQAQPTTLSAGDIVIVGWNSWDNTLNTPGNAYTDDDIDFLLLKNISAGTEIYFTDFGWTGSGFQQNQYNGCAPSSGAASDGCLKWTATSSMTAGTQVRIGVRWCHAASSGTMTSVLQSVGGNGGPGSAYLPHLSLSTGTDQIFAFQGSLASPTLIAAVQYGTTAGWTPSLTACTFTSSQSMDPNSSVGGYAFLLSNFNNNGRYAGATTNGYAPALRTAILNMSNWIFDDFGGFTFPMATSFITLPVTLSAFDAKKTEAGNVLEWKVANEENFSHYEVEMSTNGSSYDKIGTVTASGKSTYSFISAPAQASYHLYRIKMVDQDGKYVYSKVIRIDNATSKLKVVVFPNPAYNMVTISSTEPILSISVADINGKKCLQQKGNNNNSSGLDIASLKEGVYILTITTKSGVKTERIYKNSIQ